VIDPDECIDCMLCEPMSCRRSSPRTTCEGRRNISHSMRACQAWPVVQKKPAPPNAENGTGWRQRQYLEHERIPMGPGVARDDLTSTAPLSMNRDGLDPHDQGALASSPS
jgi:hypothetical protein